MRRLLLVGVLAACPGCPSEPPPECIATPLPASCNAGYEPTFANVYANTLKPNCGSDDSSCHSASGHAGGLSFADQQTAYDQLMQADRVRPSNPSCSEFIVRTSSPGKDYQMPPGDPLSEVERCALVQWVEMGALP